MSLAVAYHMKKKGKKAEGPCEEHGDSACEMCHGGEMMADGGDVEPSPSPEPKRTFPKPEDMTKALRTPLGAARRSAMPRVAMSMLSI